MRVDELTRPQAAVRIHELRFQLDRARRLIDRVVNQFQLAFGDLPLIVRSVCLDVQLAIRHGPPDAINIGFRKREDHIDWLDLRDSYEILSTVCLDEIPDIDVTDTSDAVDW